MARTRSRPWKAALERLGHDRFAAFVRAAAADGTCTAVRLAVEALDQGATPEAIFGEGDQFGYSMSVQRTGPNRFWIRFGCQLDYDVGDRGEWRVMFNDDRTVAKLIADLVRLS